MADTASATEPVLAAHSLYYSYRGTQALSAVSFSVFPRSIHGFVGPNGAGKTTTLKLLATLLKPQAGRASAFGMDIRTQCREVRRRIGFVPDHFSLYGQMTVYESLDFFGAAYGLKTQARDKVIDDLLALTDMGGRRNDYVRSLSRGMQQRLSLARALVHDPDLLLLDEPASGLDPRARIELMEILRELSRMGKTIFISSHILGELADLCDSVTIIDRGHVRYSGSMQGLLARRGEFVSYVVGLEAEHPPALEALQKLEGVTAVTKLEGRPEYLLTMDVTRTDTTAVLGTVLQSGARITLFREDVRQLAQAFMELTEPGVPS
jgi:ABC-2 type transport system ATP-binding protein